MTRTDDGEVTVVQGGHLIDTETFSQGDDRGIACAQRQVRVLIDQFGHPCVVGRRQVDRDEVALGQGAQKGRFSLRAGANRE